jgi:HSP20 family protein
VAGIEPFSDLQREMARLVDDFFGSGSPLAAGPSMPVPRLDVRENAQELCVYADLPGVKPQDVELRLEGNTLTIRGEKASEAEEKKEDYYLMERSYGRFQRSVQLPYTPDPSRVQAEFDNGVLTIHVPKEAQQERSQRIEIQSQLSPQGQGRPQVASTAASGEMPH